MPLRLHSIDRQFAHFCRTGDAEALGRVFDAAAAELLHVAAWLSGNRADAEDLLQRTFLTAIEDRAAFANERRVVPWLMVILTNHARNLRRERVRRAALPARPEPTADPIAAANDAEFAAWLSSAHAAIGAPYAEVLALHLEQGLNAKEIAARLRRPGGTVRTQLIRGLERLRQRLPEGFVAALLPPRPEPAAFAAIKATLLDAVRHNALVSAASAPAAAALASGGMMMSKKLLFLVPATLLMLLGVSLQQGWFDATATTSPPAVAVEASVPPPKEPVAPLGTAVETPSRTEAPATAAAAAEPGFGSLEVVVRWQHDRSPAAGVGVWTTVGNATWLRRDGVTDASGTCRLPHLSPARWRVGCSHADTVVEVDVVPQTCPPVELTAGRQATVRGTVVDDVGTPVADARVWIADGRGPDDRQFEIARSDARGWFEVPVRGWQLVGARKPGHAPALAMAIDAAKGDREIALRLRGTAAIVRGTVRDPDGKAIAWARVAVGPNLQLHGVGGPFSDLVQAYGSQVLTGSDGAFAFVDVMPEQACLSVWAAGFAPHLQVVSPVAGQHAEVDVQMQHGAVVAGTVRDAANQPCAGARISVDRYARSLWLSHGGAWVRSDSAGRFELRDLPAGPVFLLARDDAGTNLAKTELELVAGQRTEWNPMLGGGSTISGIVLRPDGTPFANVPVHALAGMACTPVHQGTTDAGGRFLLKNVGAEPVTVDVGDLRHEPLKSIEGVAPGTVDLEIRVTHADLPNARIRGRLVDESGSPVAATVGVPAYRGMTRIRDVATDDTGAFEIGPMRSGRRELEIRTKDRGALLRDPVELRPDQVADLGTITVPRPGSATFACFDEQGAPLANCTVWVFENGKAGRAVGGAKISNGQGRIDALPPGRWRVVTNRRGLGPADLEVRSDETVHLELRLR